MKAQIWLVLGDSGRLTDMGICKAHMGTAEADRQVVECQDAREIHPCHYCPESETASNR